MIAVLFMKGRYILMSKNYRAELVGVFGSPIEENPTCVIEEAGFQALGLNYRYLTVRVEPKDLAAAMAGLKAFQMRGINLTIPHKVEVLKYLDELSPAAKVIGAVNTVVNNNGVLYGENTDGKGFLKALKDAGVPLTGKKLTLLGAGGAARAVAVECALDGAKEIVIFNRNAARGEELAALLNEKTSCHAQYVPWTGTMDIPADTDILINATSVGLYPNVEEKPDINYQSISPDMVVSDVVINPPDTLFLKEAEKRGAKTVNGLGMLVNQAAVNFTLWTGKEAPWQVMYDAFKAEFDLK